MTDCNCDSTNPYMGPWHAIGCCRMCDRRVSEVTASSKGVPLGDEWWTLTGLARGWHLAGRLAQELASQAPGATSDATSGVPGHQEVSEAARSPQKPCGHPTCPCAEGNTP